MDTQENTSLPEDPPVTVGENEVERLLDQAQSLAEEIASSTGADADAPESPPAARAPAEDAADPLAGADAVEKTLAELGDLVNGTQSTEANGEDGPAPDPAAGVSTGPAGQDAPVVAEATEPHADRETARDEPTDEALIDDLDTELAAAIDVDLSEPLPGAGSDADAQTPDKSQQAKPRTRRSIKQLIAASRHLVVDAAKPAAVTVVNAILLPILILDRPFANLSPTTKRRIGQLALITVLMGIISLVLPGMFEHNPYEHLDP